MLAVVPQSNYRERIVHLQSERIERNIRTDFIRVRGNECDVYQTSLARRQKRIVCFINFPKHLIDNDLFNTPKGNFRSYHERRAST